MKKVAGFSLIELVVVAVITGILLSGGIAAYRSIGGRQQVKQAGISFQTNLRLFQERALAGKKPAECVTANKFLGYRVSYKTVSSYDVLVLCEDTAIFLNTINLDEGIIFTSDWSPLSISFNNQKLHVDGDQTINLSKAGLSYYYQIVIDPSGVIRGEMVSE